jgi:hypothetical protein
MIEDHKEADTLDDLENIPNESIQDYLYELIDYNDIKIKIKE